MQSNQQRMAIKAKKGKALSAQSTRRLKLGVERHETLTLSAPKTSRDVRITAPKVILAVNGHLNSFGFLRGRLMHVFTYASMTRPLPQKKS
jgi:glycine/D-amino acid oxidase-like deaminating enzyme